jgi:coenzyme F420-0:L-glutamate ligase/coenzyme F420-1:gamma-L-glutamate ligase
MSDLTMWSVPSIPIVREGDDVAELIVEGMRAEGRSLRPGDILVIAQKIVSKAEGRLVRLSDVTPSDRAHELAEITGKDPAIVQVILDDSSSILRARRGLLVVEQNSGWICANAGVDHSNVAPATAKSNSDENWMLALLPEDADTSAAHIRRRLGELTGVSPAVLINDSHGRAWRIGTVGVCIGCAGLPPVWDQRGLHDLHGYELVSSEECIADELAAAASLLMGQSDEGRPVVVIRGYELPEGVPHAPARSIQRPKEMDAFR